MDRFRSIWRDGVLGGALVLAMAMAVAVVLVGGHRTGEPTATTAPAPAVAVGHGAAPVGSTVVPPVGSTVVPSVGSTVVPPVGRHGTVTTPVVAGRLRDAAGRPVARVVLDFIGTDGGVHAATTTPDGAYALAIPVGDYTVLCGLPDTACDTGSGEDTLVVGGPSEVDLVVHPGALG